MADEGLQQANEQEKLDEDLIINQDLTTEVGVLPQTGELYLTINGILRLGTELGISITQIIPNHTDKEWDYEVEATDKEGNRRWGAVTELKSRKHSKSMAINKAQRNAINNFIRMHPRVQKAIQSYTASGPAEQQRARNNNSQRQGNPPKAQPKPQPQAKPPTPLEEARSGALQALKAALPRLQEKNISEGTFWSRVKVWFKVEESKELTVNDWKEIAAALTADPMPDWVENPQSKVE